MVPVVSTRRNTAFGALAVSPFNHCYWTTEPSDVYTFPTKKSARVVSAIVSPVLTIRAHGIGTQRK